MTDRLKKIFSAKEQKTKLITYFVGCHPTYAVSLAAIKSAIDNGASIIELGYPTSEASAEGPIIKAAHDRCLKNGVNLKEVIKLATEIRNYNNEVGIILMGYMANLYLYPIEKFTKDAVKAGVDGVLVVDAPHELKEENILRAEPFDLKSYEPKVIMLHKDNNPTNLKISFNSFNLFISFPIFILANP